jgi:hypothetical protein
MLILYLALLTAALYGVSRLLLPELAKPASPAPIVDSEPVDFIPTTNKTERLEVLLVEKNKYINVLERELKISQIQARDSEKIKVLLDEEILRLREQNRIFRSELGLPSVLSKENQTA